MKTFRKQFRHCPVNEVHVDQSFFVFFYFFYPTKHVLSTDPLVHSVNFFFILSNAELVIRWSKHVLSELVLFQNHVFYLYPFFFFLGGGGCRYTYRTASYIILVL